MFYTVYDIRETNFNNFEFMVFYIFCLIVSIIIKKTYLNGKKSILINIPIYIIFLFCLSITVYLFNDYLLLCRYLDERKVQAVEGKIQNFVPKTIWGKGPESFTVNNKYFEYSFATIKNGYRKIHGNGGVFKNGLVVRIYYVDDKIVKIERKKAI